MGCDIHLFIEKYDHKKEKWEKVGDEFENPYYKPDKPVDDWNRLYVDSPYHARDYNLFALLADVRTGPYDYVLDSPRGIPMDVSEGIQKEIKDYGGDGHSHSYFTLAELEEIDWKESPSEIDCYFSHTQYIRMKKYGEKLGVFAAHNKSYIDESVEVNRQVYDALSRKMAKPKIVTELEVEVIAQSILDSMTDENDKAQFLDKGTVYFYPVKLPYTLEEQGGAFYTETMPILQQYCFKNKIESKDLRLVFFFDN